MQDKKVVSNKLPPVLVNTEEWLKAMISYHGMYLVNRYIKSGIIQIPDELKHLIDDQ